MNTKIDIKQMLESLIKDSKIKVEERINAAVNISTEMGRMEAFSLILAALKE